MEKVTNKHMLSEIVTMTQLKRKFKQYLTDANHPDFKSGVFPRNLVITLVMTLEEVLSDSLEFVKKHETNGLYVIDTTMINLVMLKTDKYDFATKYLRKYNKTIKYQDSLFFNYKKVTDGLEFKHGSKLMIDTECKNFLSYILLSLQYDIVDLSLLMIEQAGRKTLSKEVLARTIGYFFHNDISSKIKLRLDSLDELEEADKDDEATELETELEPEIEPEIETETETENSKPRSKIEITSEDAESNDEDDVNFAELEE
ncbi:MAG: hypothetical protein Gaeavirus22_5 [Gaeavirus sp.]|uniref:Uncharacterized protein n=1 Tax=Gaeavirus sp. TaxID=2487767 RepID=A0A3G4ZZA5_9VIRU|nr:MAG: hypothetical protein Gaeavirus22_5 [Gaeavirus sp.]